MSEESESSKISRMRKFLIGGVRDPKDPRVFHKLALIAFFAWVGLGADPLSSSCYGPSEAFLALRDFRHLGIFVALGTALTIFVISASYKQIIELFPTGGGGYVVASKLLSPTLGMISGCALIVDYILTITLSIASGAEAIFSFLPLSYHQYRLEFAILGVIILIILNLRGVRESVISLAPIFMIFVITHLFAIIYALFSHAGNLPEVVNTTASELSTATSQMGFFGMLYILMHSYSMGAGTYTGIEAVSNGLPILRDPKVQTARRTMNYMAISLAVTSVGLMVGYILFHLEPVEGKTMNAVLFESLSSGWSSGWGYTFVLVTLISEGAILFVAAQAGFLDGPRVLANMAMDRWVPTKFANLSDRLVTQNGVLLMGIAALVLMVVTKGSVGFLIVLYSINVFITFVLSQAGMVRHWWSVRSADPTWRKKITVNGIGLILTTAILISVTAVKFFEGGWITIIVTGSLVTAVILIRRHYQKTIYQLRRLDMLVEAAAKGEIHTESMRDVNIPDSSGMTAVLMVNGYNGLGLHSLFNVIRLFPGIFKNFIFVQVGVVDAGAFKGASEVARLKEHVDGELEKYVIYMKRHGYSAEGVSSVGVDTVEEAERLGEEILKRFPKSVFFGGQIVFKHDTFFTRWLHNYFVFAIQRRFYHAGVPFIILPIRV